MKASGIADLKQWALALAEMKVLGKRCRVLHHRGCIYDVQQICVRIITSMHVCQKIAS